MPQQIDRATLERIKARRRVGGGGVARPASTARVSRPDPTLAKIGGYGGLILRGAGGLIPAGGFIGAGIGGGTEALAQALERVTGARKSFNPTQIGTQAGIGAIPFGRMLKGSKLFASATKGAAFGGGSTLVTDLAETGEIDPQHLKRGLLLGAGGGALSRAIVTRFGSQPSEASTAIEDLRAKIARAKGEDPALAAQKRLEARRVSRTGQPLAPRGTDPSELPGVSRERLQQIVARRAGRPTVPVPETPSAATPGDRFVEGLEPSRVELPVSEGGASMDTVRESLRRALVKPGTPPQETMLPQGGHFEDLAKLDLTGVDPRFIGPNGKLRIPAELVSVYNRLKPRWAADKAAQEAAGLGEPTVPSEDLLQLALRHARRMNERKPRDFMGAERKAHAQLYDRLQELGKRTTEATPAVPSVAKVDPRARLQIGRGAHGNVSVEFPDQAHADLYAFWGRSRRGISQAGTRGVAFDPAKGDSTAAAERLAKQLGIPREDVGKVARQYRDRITNAVKRERLGDATEYRAPKWGDETGAINPDLAYTLGTTALGAAAAPLLDDDPSIGSAIGGGAVGALAGIGLRRPDLLERLRYFSLLSGPTTHAKNVAGNVSAVLSRATEDAMTGNPARAGSIVREFFRGKTLEDLVHYFRNPSRQNTRWGSTQGVLGVPSRLMGAMDDASKAALNRGGVPASEAELITFTGEPRSQFGKALVDMQERSQIARFFMPFVRTATNIAERGLERTPGVGYLPQVRRMTNASAGTASARQALGALAMLVGSQYGDDHPLMLPALGPFAVPAAVGAALGEAAEKGKSKSDAAKAGFRAAVKSTPVPTESYQYDPARLVAQFVPNALRDLDPNDPSSLDTSRSLLAPAIKKIPFVNQSLPRKRRRASRARTRRARSGG